MHQLLEQPLLDDNEIELDEIGENSELPANVRHFLTQAGMSQGDLFKVHLSPQDLQPMLRKSWLKYLRLSQIDNLIFKSLMLPTTWVWPNAKSVLFTSPLILTQAYITIDFIKGIQQIVTPLWSSVTYTSILLDLINYGSCASNKQRAEPLLLLLGASKRSQMLSLLLSSKKMAFVPSLLFGLPLLWGSTALLGALDARPLTEKRVRELLDASQSYESNFWQDNLRWLLPFSPWGRRFNQLVRALTLDGREIITSKERYNMAIALCQQARDGRGLTQLHAIESLADIVNSISLKDFSYLQKKGFDTPTRAAVLYSKQRALLTLRQLADNYRLPQDANWLKPLARYLYANYLLWYIGQPITLSLRPTFWAVEGIKAYASFSVLAALVRALVDAIGKWVKQKHCESAGKVWRYIDLIGDYNCTKCADLPIPYSETFTDSSCFISFLEQPRSGDQIVKAIKRFNLVEVTELELGHYALTGAELGLVFEALMQKRATFAKVFINWTPNALNEVEKKRIVHGLAALRPEMLRLYTHWIDEVMAEAIAATQLLTLDLWGNDLTDEGLVALNDHYPATLQELILAFNKLTFTQVKLDSVLKRLTQLNLYTNSIDAKTIRDLYPLLKDSNLITFYLPQVTGQFNTMQLIEHLPWHTLKLLSLDQGYYDESAINSLGAGLLRSQLNFLAFRNIQFALSEPALLAEKLLAPSIKTLRLFRTNINDESLIEMASWLHHSALVELYLGHHTYISDRGVMAFSHYLPQSSIKALSLSDLNLTPAGIEALLQQVRYSRLEELSLANNQLTDESADILATYLPETPIQKLRVYNNSITGKGGAALARSLAYTRLNMLDMNDNCLGDEGAMAFATQLKKAHELTRFQLAGNNVTDQGVEALARHLPGSSLQGLLLHNNAITHTGVNAIAKALVKPQCRQPMTIVQSAVALNRPQTNLSILSLFDNPISTKGEEILCKALSDARLPLRVEELSGKQHWSFNISSINIQTCQASSASSLKAPWPYLLLYRSYQASLTLAIRSYRSLQQTIIYPEIDEVPSQALIVPEQPYIQSNAASISPTQVIAYGALYLTAGHLIKEGIASLNRWWESETPSYLPTASAIKRLDELLKQNELLTKAFDSFSKYSFNDEQQQYLAYLQANLNDNHVELTRLKHKGRVSEEQLQALESELADVDFGIKELAEDIKQAYKVSSYAKLGLFGAHSTPPSFISAKTLSEAYDCDRYGLNKRGQVGHAPW